MSDEQAARLDDHVDGRHDFDFFLGEWRVRNRKLADPLAEGPDSRTWLEFEATAKAEPILVGLGNYNTYSAPGFPGYPGFHGFALRLFDPQTGVWRIWWASTIGRGQLDTPVVGQFGDGEGRFGCDDLLGGRAAKVRFDWKDITPSSARWEQSFSFDDGRTFDTNWIMEFTRMPLDPAPVNRHEGSGGSRSARSA
jgi:hypothetical protein